MKNALLLLIIVWLLASLESCRSGYVCLAPPPRLTFQSVKKDGSSLISQASASTVIIRYAHQNDPRRLLNAQVNASLFTSYDIITNANAIGDTT